jgi:hypothetical protein
MNPRRRTVPALLWMTLCVLWMAGQRPVIANERETAIVDRAAEIFRQPAYRGFEHFARPETTAAKGERPTLQNDPSSNQAFSGDTNSNGERQKNWWEQVRDEAQSSKQSGDRSGTNSSSSGPSSTEPSSPARTSPASGESTRSGPTNTEPTHPPEQGRDQPSASTPQKAPSRTPPTAARPPSADGIRRPVRYVPKPPAEPWSGWDWNWNWDGSSPSTGILTLFGTMTQILAYGALLLTLVLLIIVIARALGEDYWNHRRPATGALAISTVPLTDDASPGETSADQFRKAALGFAAQGLYREALGQLILGAMSTIERAQWIRYRRGLTLNDYLRAVRSRGVQRQGLLDVVDIYEPVEYGRRVATRLDWEHALSGYESGFSASRSAESPPAAASQIGTTDAP